jgi:hypothetical protein
VEALSQGEEKFKSTNSTEEKCREKYGYYMGGLGQEDGYGSRRERLRANDLTQSCKTRTSNAHGTFTSLGVCNFRFHSIPDDHPKTNYMSSACSDDNVVEEYRDVKDDLYQHEVTVWPDACVGDFVRCYKVDRDEIVLLRHLCTTGLKLPAGTTHVSVDCTTDKAKQKQMKESGELDREYDGNDPYIRYHRKAQLELFAFVAIMAIVGSFFVCACLVVLHRCAFQPYLKALKRSRSDPELAGLTSPE